MTEANIWKIQVYPLSNFKTQFQSLSEPNQRLIEKLVREIAQMVDPEDHNDSMDCPGIKGFNHAVKYVINDSAVLIVALDRNDLGTHIDHYLSLFSCSE